MSQPHAPTATQLLPALDAAVTAGMCLTTMKALGRDSVLVTTRGTITGVATREGLTKAASTPGASNRPLRDACETTGLVWL